ncbi:MAG: hypothetical protein ACTSPI_16495, partial [Candidatus Heimdallarchaeaceae archaeon]
MDWKDDFPKEDRYFETENGILYCGDCVKVMDGFPGDSIDLVLTDPPYLKKYLYTYDYLADYSPKIMRDGA